MNVIASIFSGAVTLWHDAESAIEDLVAKVKAELPASANPGFDAAVSDLKQFASDALTTMDSGLAAVAPTIAAGAEKVLDDALVTMTNGLAVPLIPLTNKGVEDITALLVSIAHGWELKAKAALAANNTPAA